VSIPQKIREKLGIAPNSEVDFVEEGEKVYLVKKKESASNNSFRKFRGVATVKMTTDEIMSLTRGNG